MGPTDITRARKLFVIILYYHNYNIKAASFYILLLYNSNYSKMVKAERREWVINQTSDPHL